MFPTDFLPVTANPPSDDKVKFAIPLAPAGQVAEAALFFSRQLPADLENSFIRLGGTPLIYMDLPNGEFVSLVVRHTVIPHLAAELDKMRKGQLKPLSGVPKPGESFEGRAILVGDTPAEGAPFYLTEAGPVTVSKAPELASPE